MTSHTAGRRHVRRRQVPAMLLLCAGRISCAAVAGRAAPEGDQLEEITVTTERLGLLGTAGTASEGVVVNEELQLTPAFRVGQLIETVPGLQVTSHSGEGKANQYLLRGYNLDHGTDLGLFVEEMPVNEPTHAHGQGYTDLNFLIPELATHVTYTKGPYHADQGDFTTVGAVHIGYVNVFAPQIALTTGTLGYQRMFAGGSVALGNGNVLAAFEVQHYDGPWVNPDELHKVNAVLRYSIGFPDDEFSVTAMAYKGWWNATTDQPQRAIRAGLISDLGSLDPSDGGDARRNSLVATLSKPWAGGELRANAFVFGNQLTLWNDFTHDLIDPINGDQEEQHEYRTTAGGALRYDRAVESLGRSHDLSIGLASRQDVINVARFPTADRAAILPQLDPTNFRASDQVRLQSYSGFAQVTSRWTSWFRSILGYRYDTQSGSDRGTNAGMASGHLLAPKGSLAFKPFIDTELYVSAGRGFHSDDVRGVTAAGSAHLVGAPLLARQSGEEIGLRQQFTAAFTLTAAFYRLRAESETTYDPDAGVDSAGPGSNRRGYELNLTYQALRWLEFYGSYSGNRARYATPYDDGTGHVGRYLANAPFATGSLNVYVKNLRDWSGSIGYRYLSAFPLSADDTIQGHGYGIWSGDAHYALSRGWGLGLGVYNLADKKADAAEFWYVDRLPGEPVDGVADIHVHPLERRSVRLTLSKTF